MIVARHPSGDTVILGTDQEKLLAGIFRFVINESEVYSDQETRLKVEKLKDALGV
jgi:hypothetical protein